MGDWRDDEREKLKDRATGKFYKPQEGDNNVRFFPNMKDKQGRPWIEYPVHYNVGPDGKTVTCGVDLENEGDCYVCNKLAKLEASGKAGKRRAYDMRRVIVMAAQVAYSYGDSTKLRGPCIWSRNIGGADTLDAKIISLLTDRKHVVYDPKKGYIVHFERTGTSKKRTRYQPFVIDEEPSEIPSKLLKLAKPFDELIYDYDEKYAKAAYLGRPYERDEEDEDEDEPKSKKRGRDEEDEDEDEVDTEDEEDSEEDDEPKKKKKSKSKDEDEDEDEDGDEEEESPKKKKKSKSKDEDEEDPEEDEDDEPKKKKKSKSKDEDEDEDEADSSDGDEDEDEAPKKKKKSKSKDEDEDEVDEEVDEDEEDEEVDEEADEDEDEAPKKKAKKKK